MFWDSRGSRERERDLPMSSEFAIKINNLGKCYQIYDKPSDRLKQMLSRGRRQFFKEFWALKDVSLKVKKGETVGIIGRNGSGKSTLLQMICGTLSPTKGDIKVNGKVAALLELGAGFNPEFTGVENVYMAASIYGLTKEEIDQKFDTIATFADIGEHIDQPVKTYSSGMYVRLAFAVIANVDADILVIDEALAVGDAVFVQKCMSFIRDFQKTGTLIIVSHDSATIQNLCATSLWLNRGSPVLFGSAQEVAEAYLQYNHQEVYGTKAKLKNISRVRKKEKKKPINYKMQANVESNLVSAGGWKTGSVELLDIDFKKKNADEDSFFMGGELVYLRVTAKTNIYLEKPIIGFTFRDRLGQELFGENTIPFSDLNPINVLKGQKFSAEFIFRLPKLPNGQYAIMCSIGNGTLYDHVQHVFLHDALEVNVFSSEVRWGLVGIDFDEVTMGIEE